MKKGEHMSLHSPMVVREVDGRVEMSCRTCDEMAESGRHAIVLAHPDHPGHTIKLHWGGEEYALWCDTCGLVVPIEEGGDEDDRGGVS